MTLFYPITYTFVRVVYLTAGQTVEGAISSSARLVTAAVLLPFYAACEWPGALELAGQHVKIRISVVR